MSDKDMYLGAEKERERHCLVDVALLSGRYIT